MTTEVLAAAASLDEPDRARRVAAEAEMCVPGERGQPRAVRRHEGDLVESHQGRALRQRVVPREGVGECNELRLHLAAQHGARAERAEQGFVHRRVEAVDAHVRVGRHPADVRHRLDGDSRRGVHGDVDAYQIRGTEDFRVEPLE